MLDFKKELKKVKEFYFNVWRGHEKPCPAFDGEIVKVGRAGWSHIVFSAKRNTDEVLERLSYVKYARELIERSTFIQNHRKIDNIEYWELQGMFGDIVIRTVIRSVNSRNKHVFSVFRVKPFAQKRKTPLPLGLLGLNLSP